MSVVERLPEGGTFAAMREIREASSEIKAAQTTGSSQVIMKQISSQSTWDITVPAGQTKDVLVVFTPSDLAFGGGLVYRVMSDSQQFGGATVRSELLLSSRLRVTSDNKQRWQFRVFNSAATDDAKFKFFFTCVGSGTFSCSLVS